MAFSRRKRLTQSQRRSSQKRRRHFETLETRRLLAVYFVDSTDDNTTGVCAADNAAGNNNCTIRLALQEAELNPGADTIQIPNGSYVLDQINGALDIRAVAGDDLSLIGNVADPSLVEIDANNQSRVFEINGDAASPFNALFAGMTIQNGVANDFTGGGGLNALSGDADLTIDNVILQNNTAAEDAGSPGSFNSGGALALAGNVTITNSVIQNNTATLHGGGINYLGDDVGDALTVRDSTISGNQAGDPLRAAGIYTGVGYGGGAFVGGDTVNFDNVTISGNSAGDSGGGVFANATSFSMTRSDVLSNFAQGSDSGGGGVYVRNGSFNVNGGNISSNQSISGGGGFESFSADGTMDGTTLDLNQVTGGGLAFEDGGGGVAIIGAEVSLLNLTVTNNTAPAGGGVAGVASDITILNSTIANNDATSNAAGGGGVGVIDETVTPTNLIIGGSTIVGNTTAAEGAGVGAVDVNVIISQSTVDTNIASGGRAGGIGVAGILQVPTLTATQVTVSDNQSSGDGGGIAVASAGLSLENVTISANMSTGANAGGIAYDNTDTNVTRRIAFSTITANTAPVGIGSNIAAQGAAIDIENSIFSAGTGAALPGVFNSLGGNIDSATSMGFGNASDLIDTDPLLGPLQDNGGRVFTHALLTGSPAIDSATTTFAAFDARGLPRLQDGDSDALAVSDIGAFEGEDLSPVVELLLQARDLNDNAIAPDVNGEINVTVGDVFHLELSSLDLRTGPEQLGVAKFVTDITLSTQGVLVPALTSTQFLTFPQALINEVVGTIDFDLSTGGVPTVTIDVADFTNDPTGTLVTAIGELGYTAQQFDVSDPILDNVTGDLTLIVRFLGTDLVNLNQPAILGTVQGTSVSITPSTRTVDPLDINGEINPAAVPFNLNLDSRNVGADYFGGFAIGSFDTVNGFQNVGAGGATSPPADASVPFDSLSVPVLVNAPVQDLVVTLVPALNASNGGLGSGPAGPDSPSLPLDVNGDGLVTALDPILIVNDLAGFSGSLRGDVNEDGIVSAIDVLFLINELSMRRIFDTQDAVTFLDGDGDLVLWREDIATNPARIFTDGDASIVINAAATANPILTVPSVFLSENDGTITLPVTLDVDAGGPFTVDYAFIDVTTEAADYQNPTGTLSFAGTAGEQQLISIPIVDDGLVEANELFQIVLSNPTATVDVSSIGQITITDNDVATLTITDANSIEGSGVVSFGVTLSGDVDVPFTVDARTLEIPGGATAGVDFTPDTRTLNFSGADGQTVTFDVTVDDDIDVEADESFTAEFFNLNAQGRVVRFSSALSGITEIGSFNTPALARGVHVVGSTAYVADGTNGLVILDVTDPTNPVQLGGFDTADIALKVQVDGTTAYVADESDGLVILDVSDPANVTQLGSLNVPNRRAVNLQVDGNTVYIAEGGTFVGDAGLRVVDVSDPANVVDLGSFNTPNTNRVADVVVVGTTAYLAAEDDGFLILDVSDPANIVQLGGDAGLAAQTITIDGTTAYVGLDDALVVLDVSDPGAITTLGTLPLTTGVSKIEIAGNTAFVSLVAGNIRSYDISDPTNITETASVTTLSFALDLQVVGSIAFAATHTAGLRVLDLGTVSQATGTILDDDVLVGDVDVSISVTDSPDPVAPGATLTYTLTVTNSLVADATSVQVLSNLPTDLSFLGGDVDGDTDGVTLVGTTVEASIGTLQAGQTATVQIDVAVSTLATGTITNDFTVTSNENDSDLNNNLATELTTVSSLFSALDDTFTIPEDAGPSTLGVLANDSPAGLTIVSVTPVNGPGTVAINGNVVTFTPFADAFGQATFGYTVTDGINTASAAATVNITSVNDSPVVNDDAFAAPNRGTQLINVADLLLNDSFGPSNENQTLTVTGVGANSANGGDLSFTLGDATISYTPSATFTGVVDSFTYTITDGVTTATGTVSVALPSIVVGAADLSLVSETFADRSVAGGSLFVPFTVTNLSAQDATDVVAVLTLDPQTTFVSGASTNGTFVENGNVLTVTIPTLAAGATDSISLNLLVAAGATAGSLITTSGAVSANTSDPNLANNTAVSVDSVLGLHRLSTGNGDGDITIDVDQYGSFGTNAFPVTSLADFDPTGPIGAASAVFLSFLGIREASTGARLGLDEIPSDLLQPSSIAGDLTTATSTFSIGSFDVQLIQEVAPNFDTSGNRNGSILNQTFSITNSTAQPVTADLVRYLDGDLLFDGSLVDGGGRLTDGAGNLILFETDAGGTGASDATFIGITDQGGTAPATDRFMIEDFDALEQRIIAGTPLTDMIQGDGDLDGFVDVGNEFDVALAMRRLLTLDPGQTAQYVNSIALGAQPTSIVSQLDATINGHVSCDANGNGIEDPNEAVVGTTVFLDADGDRFFDANERSTLTDSSGNYSFIDVTNPSLAVVAEIPGNCISVSDSPGVSRTLDPPTGISRTDVNAGDLARSITAADIDGDGDLDLLVANDISNDIAILQNNEGNFNLQERITLGDRPQSITSFQTSTQTLPTIAVAGIGTPSNGGSIFTLNGTSDLNQLAAGNGPIDVVLDDFDGNGEVDMLVASFRSSDLQLIFNGSETLTLDLPSQVVTVGSGDVNGDGNRDVVAASAGFGDDESELVFVAGDGMGQFSDPLIVSDLDRLVSVNVAELDSDPDSSDSRIFALSEAGSMLIFSVETGSLEEVGSVSVSEGASSFATGDFNNDGLTDLAVGNLGDQLIELYIGDGAGGFRLITSVQNVPAPSDLVVGDFNGDLSDDIAVANFYQDPSGNGNYQLPSTATILLVDIGVGEIPITGADTVTIDFAFQNADPSIQLDVSGEGEVTALDALRVMNALNQLSAEGESVSDGRAVTDVDGDGRTSAIDALMIINHLARQSAVEALEDFDFPMDDDDEEEKRFEAVDVVLTHLLNS